MKKILESAAVNYSEFLEKMMVMRSVPVIDDITQEKYSNIINVLLLLDNESAAPIKLVIDSPGGTLIDARHLRDLIELQLRSQVHGIVTGRAHSSAFLLLQGCDRRSALPSATFLFHGNNLGGLRIDQPDRDKVIAELEELFEGSLKIIAAKSGQPMKKLREWSRQERLFNAKEALKLGFIDSIKVRKHKKIV